MMISFALLLEELEAAAENSGGLPQEEALKTKSQEG